MHDSKLAIPTPCRALYVRVHYTYVVLFEDQQNLAHAIPPTTHKSAYLKGVELACIGHRAKQTAPATISLDTIARICTLDIVELVHMSTSTLHLNTHAGDGEKTYSDYHHPLVTLAVLLLLETSSSLPGFRHVARYHTRRGS